MNLEIQNIQTKLQLEDPFSIRVTDVSPINNEEIKTSLSMKDNIVMLSQSCRDGHLTANHDNFSKVTGRIDNNMQIKAHFSNPMQVEEFNQMSSRLDNKLRFLSSKIDQLQVQFDLEKDGEEFCEYIQKQDF